MHISYKQCWTATNYFYWLQYRYHHPSVYYRPRIRYPCIIQESLLVQGSMLVMAEDRSQFPNLEAQQRPPLRIGAMLILVDSALHLYCISNTIKYHEFVAVCN